MLLGTHNYSEVCRAPLFYGDADFITSAEANGEGRGGYNFALLYQITPPPPLCLYFFLACA